MNSAQEKFKKILGKAAKLETGKELSLAEEFISIEENIGEIKDSVSNLEKTVSEQLDSMSNELKKKLEFDFQINKDELIGSKGETGDKGDSYILTPDDKKQIASLIKVPVVDRVIERIETVTNQPTVTQNIVEVAMYETREQLVNKINTGTEDDIKIEAKQISGLDKYIKSFKNPTHYGMHSSIIELVAGTGISINNSNPQYPIITSTATGGVTSVNGQTGVVVLTTTNISEGSNLYFTNARAVSAMAGLYESPLTFTSPLLRSTNTISLAGLSGLGTANQILGMNNAGTAYEYKTVSVSSTAVANDVGVTLSTANSLIINLPSSSGTVRGVLTSTDWSTFNGKESALTFSTGLTRATNTITANLSTGVSGGQSVIGGTASGNNLTLSSTSNATKGKILFGTSAYDEVNNRMGIRTASPTDPFHIVLPTVGTASYFKLSSATASSFHTYHGTTASNQYAWITNHRYTGSTWVSDDLTRGAWRMTQVCETSDANSIFDIDFWVAGAPNTGYSVFYINGLGQPTFPKLTTFTGGTSMVVVDSSGNLSVASIPSGGSTAYSVSLVKPDGSVTFYPTGADTDTDRADALLSALGSSTAGDKIYIGVGRFDASAGSNTFTVPDLVDLQGAGEDKSILVNTDSTATLDLAGRHTISYLQVKPEYPVSSGNYDTAILMSSDNTITYLKHVKTNHDVFGLRFSKNVDGKIVYLDNCSFNGQVFGIENDGTNPPVNLTIYAKDSSISVLGATSSDFTQAIAVPAYQNTTIIINDCDIVARNGGTTETTAVHAFESCTVKIYDTTIDVSSSDDDGGKVSSIWAGGDSANVSVYGGKMSTTGLNGADYQDLYATNSVASIYVQGGQGSIAGGAYIQTCATLGVITFAYETPGLNFEAYRAVTANDTFTLYDYCINSTSGSNLINLPDATMVNIPVGKRYEVKNSDTGNNVTFSGNGANIDGSASQTLFGATRQSMTVRWTGAEWIII